MQEGIEATVTNLVPCVFVATKCDLPKVQQVPITMQTYITPHTAPSYRNVT